MKIAMIICILIWSFLVAEIIYFFVRKKKHHKRFNDLHIGSIYGVIYVNKKIKNPFLRTSIEFYFMIIDKEMRKGRCYVKYRKYNELTNTLGKEEYTMEYRVGDVYGLIKQTINMSIWQKYDNLTDIVSTWLEDLEYVANKYANTEMQDLIVGYKNDMNTIYKKVLV